MHSYLKNYTAVLVSFALLLSTLLIACTKSDTARTNWFNRLLKSNWKIVRYEKIQITDQGQTNTISSEANCGTWSFSSGEPNSLHWQSTYTGTAINPIQATDISSDPLVQRVIYLQAGCAQNCERYLTIQTNTADQQVWERVTPDYANGVRYLERYTAVPN